MKRAVIGILASLAINSCIAAELVRSPVVRITAPDGRFGQGVLLDQRRILTAAHVVDEAPNATFNISTLAIAQMSAKVEKVGNREGVDLAILTLDSDYPSASPAIKACVNESKPGDRLLVRFVGGDRETSASHEFIHYAHGDVFSHATEAFFSRGISGSPVFRTDTACLAGVISKFNTSSVWSDVSPKNRNCIVDNINGVPSTATCVGTLGTVFVGPEEISNFIGPAR